MKGNEIYEWTQYPQPYCAAFPYLAWIPLNPSNYTSFSLFTFSSLSTSFSFSTSSTFNVNTQTLNKKVIWTDHPDKSEVHVINDTVYKALKAEWSLIKADVEASEDGLSQRLPSVQYPQEAYFKAMTALDHLG